MGLVLACGLAGRAAAQSVHTDFDTRANFGKYHTYFSVVKTQWDNPLQERRVAEDIDSVLAAKGWQRVDRRDQADAVVAIHGATRARRELSTFYDDPGWTGWGWRRFGAGFGRSTTSVRMIPVGTMVVDIFDRQSQQLVWRGTAKADLSDNPSRNTSKDVKAVAKMFHDFPPRVHG